VRLPVVTTVADLMDASLNFSHGIAPITRLLCWTGASLMLHVMLVTLTGGSASQQTRQPLSFDIRLVTHEPTQPVTVEGAPPEIEVHRANQELALAEPVTALKPPPAVSPPESAVEVPFPFNTYLDSGDVDVRAEPANEVMLSYPPVAYIRRQGGVVRITLYINEQGGLDRSVLVDASPAGVFEKDALETVSKLQFYPAQRNGVPVKSRKTIEVIFDPHPDPARLKSITPGSSAAGK
jgi:TonB family protein